MNNKIHEKVCGVCSIKFLSSWGHSKYCSKECRMNFSNARFGRKVMVNTDIPSGTVGAISEYIVVTHLLKKGYAVFHASSPSCFCDIVAIKNKKTIYIEARTGYTNLDGTMTFPVAIRENQGKPDIFAVVDRNTSEVYFFNIDNRKVKIDLI